MDFKGGYQNINTMKNSESTKVSEKMCNTKAENRFSGILVLPEEKNLEFWNFFLTFLENWNFLKNIFLDLPPSYEEVMRSKEKVLNQKLEVMRNQLETLDDYAQVGFLDLSLANQSLSIWVHFENPSQQIQNQPSTSQSLPGWHCYTTWQN